MLLGLAFVLYLFPFSFLEGHGAFFEQGDASQHVTGWLFYARDSWHVPLLYTERLNHPDGVVIAFTDSIPLAALFFKTIVRWLPAGFHYLGWWQVVVFISQAVAATFLLRVMGQRHLLATLSAACFALVCPALLWRIGHTSLMTHSVIMFALAFYFLGRQAAWSAWKTTTAMVTLCLVALTVHPYLLAFAYALFLAFLADQAVAGEGWTAQLPRLVASALVLAGGGALLGYFGNGTTTTGFGFYSMNLTAPFCGSRFYSCVPMDGAVHQFAEYHFSDATGGQYEGFNYLGAGLLLLLPFAIISGWRDLVAFPRRCPALLLALILCTIYALSNKIYFGTQALLSFPLPQFMDKLTGTFRASGRFFWVVSYLLLFSTLAALLKRHAWPTVLLVAVALPLQWLDTQPLRKNIINTALKTAPDDLAPLSPVLAGIDKIHLYPAFGCGAADVKIYWFVQRVAARYEKLLDTGYIARPNVDCEHNDAAFAAPFRPKQLYVMPATYLSVPFQIPAGFRQAIARRDCAIWQVVVLCVSDGAPKAWSNGQLPGSEVVALKSPNRAEWRAAVLPTQIGALVGGRLVPTDRQRLGYLSYGPYVALSPGRYRFTIAYASQDEPGKPVGKWDVYQGQDATAAKTLAAGGLNGTSGHDSQIEGDIRIDRLGDPLEIRTFFDGGADLQLIGLSLIRMP